MKGISIEERAINLAHYIIETKETVRSTAKTFGIVFPNRNLYFSRYRKTN